MSYTILLQKLNEKGCSQVSGGDALRMLYVSIMFWSCPQNLWDFHGGFSVGQVHPTKAN
jgi:hypothetical protein